MHAELFLLKMHIVCVIWGCVKCNAYLQYLVSNCETFKYCQELTLVQIFQKINNRSEIPHLDG
jgi:hypothetical protein